MNWMKPVLVDIFFRKNISKSEDIEQDKTIRGDNRLVGNCLEYEPQNITARKSLDREVPGIPYLIFYIYLDE